MNIHCRKGSKKKLQFLSKLIAPFFNHRSLILAVKKTVKIIYYNPSTHSVDTKTKSLVEKSNPPTSKNWSDSKKEQTFPGTQAIVLYGASTLQKRFNCV